MARQHARVTRAADASPQKDKGMLVVLLHQAPGSEVKTGSPDSCHSLVVAGTTVQQDGVVSYCCAKKDRVNLYVVKKRCTTSFTLLPSRALHHLCWSTLKLAT